MPSKANLEGMVGMPEDREWPADEVCDWVETSIRVSRMRDLEEAKYRARKLHSTSAEKDISTSIWTPAAAEWRPFEFLKLPQELRDEIYNYALEDCDSLFLSEKDRVVSSSKLHLVCREIDTQMVALLVKAVADGRRKIICTVVDFDFKPLIVTLNWWVDAMKDFKETNESTTEENPGQPELGVRLSISEAWNRAPALDSLRKWYQWVNANSNDGLGIDIEYLSGNIENVKRTGDLLKSFVYGDGSHPRHGSVSRHIYGEYGQPQPPRELVRMFASFEAWSVDYSESSVYDQRAEKMKEVDLETLKYLDEDFADTLEA